MGKNFVHHYETRTRSARARASRARLPQMKKQHILQCVARHLIGERRAIASFSLHLPPFSQDNKISCLLPPIDLRAPGFTRRLGLLTSLNWVDQGLQALRLLPFLWLSGPRQSARASFRTAKKGCLGK